MLTIDPTLQKTCYPIFSWQKKCYTCLTSPRSPYLPPKKKRGAQCSTGRLSLMAKIKVFACPGRSSRPVPSLARKTSRPSNEWTKSWRKNRTWWIWILHLHYFFDFEKNIFIHILSTSGWWVAATKIVWYQYG